MPGTPSVKKLEAHLLGPREMHVQVQPMILPVATRSLRRSPPAVFGRFPNGTPPALGPHPPSSSGQPQFGTLIVADFADAAAMGEVLETARLRVCQFDRTYSVGKVILVGATDHILPRLSVFLTRRYVDFLKYEGHSLA